jgi:hypothetical protein
MAFIPVLPRLIEAIDLPCRFLWRMGRSFDPSGSMPARSCHSPQEAVGQRGDTLLTIPLEHINNSGHAEYFCGERKRLATCTSVQFIGSNRLVTSHFVGQRMYLIRFDLRLGTYEVECCIPTRFAGRPACTDLLDFDGESLIAASNGEDPTVSLYRLRDGRIEHERDVPVLDDEAQFMHGVKFVPGNGDVVCAISPKSGAYVYFVAHRTGEVVFKFRDEGWIPKDAAFVDERTMIIVKAAGAVKNHACTPYASKVSLVQFDVVRKTQRMLDEAHIPDCHIDACVFRAGQVVFSNQLRDSVSALTVKGNRLRLDWTWKGYSFPHGVDIHPTQRLLAVSNYGTNDIVIRKM